MLTTRLWQQVYAHDKPTERAHVLAEDLLAMITEARQRELVDLARCSVELLTHQPSEDALADCGPNLPPADLGYPGAHLLGTEEILDDAAWLEQQRRINALIRGENDHPA